jgi:hypothetical protein
VTPGIDARRVVCKTRAVSPLDPRTLGTDTPTTLDGRRYPEHLREFERYDGELLPLVQEGGAVTFDDLVTRIGDRKVRAILPRWIASAQWRGLIERHDGPGRKPWTYVLGPQGQSQTPHAA